MKGRDAVLVALSLSMLTGMRDPFRQPEDHCHGAELAQWRFQGMVSRGNEILDCFRTGSITGAVSSNMRFWITAGLSCNSRHRR